LSAQLPVVPSKSGSRATRRPRLAGLVAPALAALLALACQGSVEDRLTEAQALQEAGQFHESIEPLRAILEEQPENARANELLGAALFQTGQPSVAVYPLEKAARDPGHAVSAGLLLARVYLATDAFENAVRAADQVLAVKPDLPAAVYVRGHANLGAGKHEDALVDAERLVQLTPDEYQALLLRAAILWDLRRDDEAEKAYIALKDAAATKDPTTAAKGWLALAAFYRNKGDKEKAEREFEQILKQHPTDGTALSFATEFYDETGRPERGTELWRNAVKEAPESSAFRFALAQRLASQGQAAEADQVLVETTELFGTPDTWVRLAELRSQAGRHAEAVVAMDKAVELAGPSGANDTVLMKHVELLVNAGDLARAREISAKIQEDAYRDLMEGRILLADDKPREALAKLDAGVRRWPNNAGARYLAGRAALAIGDYERAASELREAYRAGPAETEASLALATLELSRGNTREAIEFAGHYLQTKGFADRPGAADARAVVVRAMTAQKEWKTAREVAAELEAMPGQKTRGVVERAGVERAAAGPKAAAEVVAKSGLDLTDPANELALRALVDDLVATGQTEEAARRVAAALAKHPDTAEFHDLQGRLLALRGDRPGARAEFERALAAKPDFAPALAGLAAMTLEQERDVDAAMALLDRAAASYTTDSRYAYQAAQLALAHGRTDDAERRLREIVARDAGNAQARNDLAWILAEKGAELDFALALAQDAARVMPTADVLDTLGWVQLKRKDAAAAAKTFQQALAQKPDAASTRYRLGLALAEGGDESGALREIQTALAAGNFPEAEAARAQAAKLATHTN